MFLLCVEQIRLGLERERLVIQSPSACWIFLALASEDIASVSQVYLGQTHTSSSALAYIDKG